MKTNAIIRIIAWSLVIILLLGILCAFVFGGRLFRRSWSASNTPEATMIPVPLEETPSATVVTAADNLNVHSEPDQDNTAIAMIPSGDSVSVTRLLWVDGTQWAYITAPQTGWVMAQHLNWQENTPLPAELKTYVYSPDTVRGLEIDWVTGTIRIEAADVQQIQISETEVSDPRYEMHLKQNGRKLSIAFCQDEKLLNFGFGIHETVSKDLTILVPLDWECETLEVDTAAANLNVSNLVISKVDFDGASGVCEFVNCVVGELDLDTASGDVTFQGTLKALDCDAASASVTAVLDNVPSQVDMDSMSGDLDLTLPSTAGFTVTMDAMSSDFISDFAYTSRNGSYVCGDGACRITMDAMSGDVYIREFKSADAAPEATAATEVPATSDVSGTHRHTESCTTNPDSCPDNSTHHTEPHHN